MRQRAVPHRALRRVSSPREPLECRVVGRDEAGTSAHLDVQVAQRHALLDRHRPRRRAGVLHDVAARARNADFRYDSQGDVLGGDVRRELAVEPHPHPLRPLHRHHLRRENMRELGCSAAERQCSDASDGARVQIRHRMRRARQHHAELRRDHVRNALLGVVKIENFDLISGAALAHRLDKRRARRIGVVVAAGLGRNGMIHRENVRSGRRTGRCCFSSASKACGACSSCSTWRSM